MASGFIGPEFCDKAAGSHILSEGLKFERYTAEEAQVMSEALAQCDLPSTTREAGAEFAWKIQSFNFVLCDLNEAMEGGVTLDAHAFLETGRFPPVPDNFLDVVEANLRSFAQ